MAWASVPRAVARAGSSAGGADAGRGSGLRGLRDRVEALGGQFEVTSVEGSGTTVRALLPVEPGPLAAEMAP